VVLVVLHLAAEQVPIEVEVAAVEVAAVEAAAVEAAAVAEVAEAAEAVAEVTAGVVAGMFAPQKVIIPRPPLQLPTITHRMTPHQSVQSAWRAASSGCLRVGTYFTLHVFTIMLFIGRQMLM
jgi:hypothetical protein